jgi:hypothetical protein
MGADGFAMSADRLAMGADGFAMTADRSAMTSEGLRARLGESRRRRDLASTRQMLAQSWLGRRRSFIDLRLSTMTPLLTRGLLPRRVTAAFLLKATRWLGVG